MTSEKLRVRVKPGSRKAPLIEQGADGILTVHVAAKPVGGAANEELVAAIAKHVGARRADVRISAGESARVKTVTIERG